MIRVLIADDHPVVLEGLSKMLSTEEDLEVVGEARNGAIAVQMTRQLRPDVVLMDVRMPVMDGVRALREIRKEMPAARIIILTTYDDDESIYEGIAAGAKGYLLKDVPKEELFQAIRIVKAGGSLVQPAMATKLFDRISSAAERTAAPPDAGLTPRELEVLRMIASGMRNRQIAETLCITERTVKAHIAKILSKLGGETRAGAITLAIRKGLL